MMQRLPAIFDRSQAEPSPSRGKDNDATLYPPQFNKSDPSDRRAQLSALLARIQTDGARRHEQEIDQIRTVDHLTESEREIVLEIFRSGYEVAEAEQRQDKMWAYQRLLRRLLLHQPLDQPIPLTIPSDKTPPERTAQSKSATIRKNVRSQENAPNRLRKRIAPKQLVRCGVFLGGTAALLWTLYADRALIVGGDLYSLVTTNQRNSVPASAETKGPIGPAISAGESADAAEFAPLIERASVAQPEPAMNKYLSVEAGAAMTENTTVAAAATTARSSKPNSPSAESKKSPPLDVPPESQNSSLTIYRTVRQILLRDEPRFGAPAQIMLDRGARLIVLEINGPWLMVKMENTGALGFAREEFVVPVTTVPASVTSLNKGKTR